MKMKLNISGKAYDVQVEYLDEIEEMNASRRDGPVRQGVALAPAATAPAPSAPVSGPGSVVAQLAGLIVNVPVNEGDSVKAGDVVVILEAMKMATNVVSHRDGKVKKISVTKGQNVKQGEVLLELE